MYIDKKSPVPAYYQLKELITGKINRGEYEVGGVIPSERCLSETLGISRMTVRQALGHLVADGLLKREKGRGTFVSKPKLVQDNIMSFSQAVAQKGLLPAAKVLDLVREDTPPDVAGQLGLDPGERIYRLKRLRSASGTPVAIEQNFIPEKYCPALERHDLSASLYALLSGEYGFSIQYADHVIEAARPGKDEKELLGITGPLPVLKVACVYYTSDDLRLFFERSVYRSDEYQYNMRVRIRGSLG